MNENHKDEAENGRTATEDKLWHPPLSPKDQQKLDRLRSKGKKSTSNWTGFAGRTLWDWIQFFAVLAIPIIVATGTLYFTQQITLQQAHLSIEASERQHQTDLQIADDQQRKATLKSYLDDMSNLLLNHHLRQSKPEDEVSQVARERTLTTLRVLDGYRNNIVVQFLKDAQLISGKNAVIDLSHADLSNDDLSYTNLSGINLSNDLLFYTDLSYTNLSYTNLNHAILAFANLAFANLSYANLDYAKLGLANLDYANLSSTRLNSAQLGDLTLGADTNPLSEVGSNFRGPRNSDTDISTVRNLTQQQLDQVYTCLGTILPKGLTCHHNKSPDAV